MSFFQGEEITEEDNLYRFRAELEFLLLLSLPTYRNFLHERGYFDDPAFLKYLRYLTYFSAPEYS